MLNTHDAHLTGLLTEAEGELDAASAPTTALEVVAAGAIALLPPGASGVVGRLAGDIVKQRQAHRDAASRRMLAAIASVPNDLRRRLEADPTFASFVERVVNDAASSEQAEKVEYYGRLLQRSAPATGPSEDERLRLLETLNALGLRHLRLFHSLANPEAPLDAYSTGAA